MKKHLCTQSKKRKQSNLREPEYSNDIREERRLNTFTTGTDLHNNCSYCVYIYLFLFHALLLPFTHVDKAGEQLQRLISYFTVFSLFTPSYLMSHFPLHLWSYFFWPATVELERKWSRIHFKFVSPFLLLPFLSSPSYICSYFTPLSPPLFSSHSSSLLYMMHMPTFSWQVGFVKNTRSNLGRGLKIQSGIIWAGIWGQRETEPPRLSNWQPAQSVEYEERRRWTYVLYGILERKTTQPDLY